MRNLIQTILILLILQTTGISQKMGNGVMTTQSRNFEEITELLVNINGKVKIICNSSENKIELTYDENIIDYVSTEYDNGFIEIGQSKWVEGTKEIEITVYTNSLEAFYNDSWSKIQILNLDQEEILISSTISDIYLEGTVENLELIS